MKPRVSFVDNLKLDDIYSIGLLQPLLNGFPFVPFTGASLRPFCLNHIINDVLVNNRKNIIEFGSGISSILIGRLIKNNNLNATLISIEHDLKWRNVLRGYLNTEKLEDVVEVLHLPLMNCKLSIENNDWYDIERLSDSLGDKVFDMVLIDGPPAWEASKGMARYPALPFIRDRLKKDFSIYLDDANRQGESVIIKKWEREYGINFNLAGGTLAFSYGGNAFYTQPFVY